MVNKFTPGTVVLVANGDITTAFSGKKFAEVLRYEISSTEGLDYIVYRELKTNKVTKLPLMFEHLLTYAGDNVQLLYGKP